MAKRMYNERLDKLDEQEEPIEEVVLETVRLVLQKDVVLTYTGKITGNVYVFNRAGSQLDVDKRDAEIMLMRKGSPSCCGSQPTPYFDVVR